MPKRILVFALLSIFVSFVGCSNRPAEMPTLYPCKITVTQDGAPLAEASVLLVNISDADMGNKWTPMGKTDTSGVAVMQTNSQYSGAVAGKYRIIVDKTETEPSKLGPPPAADTQEYDVWSNKVANENLAEFTLVEAVYSSSKTPHEIDVAKGSNDKTIDVGKAVRNKR